MKVLETSVYLGPNLYAHFPVIRMTVDLEHLEAWPTVRIGKGFIGRLLKALPGLKEHTCSFEETGGFIRRLTEDEGTWLGHVLEHCALELQCAAGVKVSYGKTRSTNEAPGCYHVVYEYDHADVGLEGGKLAIDLIHSLLPKRLRPKEFAAERFVFEERRDSFIRFAQRLALGPSTASLVQAAKARDIPFLRLNRYSLIQMGHGRYQKRIQATITSETHHIAVEIASDKEETNRILSDLGLPVPRQRMVYSEDDAARAAKEIGFPVVVKPLDANHGRGVSINLNDTEHVRAAFGHAQAHSRAVIVESFIQGLDHRMLVVGGELIAVAQRLPGHVVGDGKRTVEELVEETNRDPRRGIGHEKVLTRIEFDHQADRILTLRGYTRQSIPPAGEIVFLRSTGNLSTGGTSIDKTDVIHPDNREMAIRAAKAIGLDVAGIDFLTTDISKSYKETGGAICEVNAAPGFRMHVAPSEGQPRDVAGPVLDMLFPPGTPSRIPIASITGTNGKTTTSRMLAHILKLSGYRVGLTTTDGVYIDGHKTVDGDMTGPTAARMVLRDPSVDCAVLETARGGLLRRGMGYRKCTVAACLNVQSDHLGLHGINTLEELALVKRIPIEVAQDTAVLNADDSLCLRMADHTQAGHVCYVTMSPAHSLVKEHVQSGGRAVVLEEGMTGQIITIYDHGAHVPLVWTHQIPATLDGRALHNVQNAMFAAAMAYSMALKLEDIRNGLQTFDATFFQVPGRMNIFDEHPFRVILDYGHNPSAVQAMCLLVERLRPKGRRICVLAAPGDRRNEDIREITRLTSGRFDHYICRRDDSLRGRKPDEVPNLLRDGLLEHGVDPSRVDVIADEQQAIEVALRMGKKDDILLIFGDKVDRSWKQITSFCPDGEVAIAPMAEGELVRPTMRLDLADTRPIELLAGELLIRDERGVRLAREEED
ncbi:MAG: cyanophycin synthetase [Candidatus Glassbacteria bacterium RBG_16_58_8]|uniref:Cyanophycin synthetase n=1 Tax=Candidatus Glassbacteria bacterium RBG_16_58_8 TaxID=1817866 RepID=A0A1F5YCB3_9BACT|nr:MAG: cyanophycin synthetase [Candidatus Glassbacteria bacterium RBG_16_58_8]